MSRDIHLEIVSWAVRDALAEITGADPDHAMIARISEQVLLNLEAGAIVGQPDHLVEVVRAAIMKEIGREN